MVKLPIEEIKAWLDGLPGRREVKIEFRIMGAYICLRQISATADKAEYSFAWELLLESNLDLLQLKLLECLEKLS